MVRFSQPPVLSLGTEVVTLGLSGGRGEIESQLEKVKRESPVSDLNAEADVFVFIAGNNDIIDNIIVVGGGERGEVDIK